MFSSIFLTLVVICNDFGAAQYISSTNSAQGQCVYADFELNSGSIQVREAVKRVVNGKPADINAWPWLVALLTPGGPISSQGRRWDLNCGGALIHPEWVLTAAHCVISTENETYYFRRAPNDILARIGDSNLYVNDIPNAVDIPVDRSYTHPQYDPLLVDTGNDIALLHLSRPFTRTSVDPIRTACLPSSTALPAGSKCYVAGWGATSTEGDTSATPLYTTLQISTWAQCQRSYEFESRNAGDGRMFCAGPIPGQGRTDTCTGDSGGPIFCRNPSASGLDGLWQLAGLVSFGGEQCAPRDSTPGVYTSIPYYRQWILDTMGASSIPAIPSPVPVPVPTNPPAPTNAWPWAVPTQGPAPVPTNSWWYWYATTTTQRPTTRKQQWNDNKGWNQWRPGGGRGWDNFYDDKWGRGGPKGGRGGRFW